jgi:CheY-like chemotaxis protein/anti-sigma regulatory factor (Ser/Thr protein kinase)
VKSVLSIAIDAVERAASLTRQLLAYAGKGAFVRQAVSVSEIAFDAVRLLRESLPKNVEVRMELASGLPTILMDASQMQLVLTNLILNAAEAIGGTQSGAVTIRTELAGDALRIEVADSGCGMDAETQSRAFDPFFTTKFTGRGLGLAAVQGIIRTLNGRIVVKSAPGQGTRVEILVPLKAPTPVPQKDAAPDLAAARPGGVLIADDEPAIRSLAAALLKKRGIRVFEAATGKQAIECLAVHGAEIRAILLDMTMPELHGYEALPTITKLRPGIRVVVSSGYSDQEVKQHFKDMNVHSFLPKPYTGEQLLSHLLPDLDAN